jgi:hypothetical protein
VICYEEVGDCWEGQGYRYPNGYVQFYDPKIKTRYAHIIVYMYCNTDYNPKLDVRHTCGHPWCVKPNHLIQGTRKENMADARRHGTLATRERHGRSKLTEEQVQDIRGFRSIGMTLKSIANMYGITFQQVSNICREHSWK